MTLTIFVSPPHYPRNMSWRILSIILVFPSLVGNMLWSFGFLLLVRGIFHTFFLNDGLFKIIWVGLPTKAT